MPGKNDASASMGLDLSDLEKAIDRVVTTKLKELNAAADKSATALKKIEASSSIAGRALDGFRKVAGALGIGLGISALVSYGKGFIDLAGTLADMSVELNTTVPKLREVQKLLSDKLTADQTTAALGQLNAKLIEAKAGSEDAQEALINLGITSDNYGDDVTDVFTKANEYIKAHGTAIEDVRQVFDTQTAAILTSTGDQIDKYKEAKLTLDSWKQSFLDWGIAAVGSIRDVIGWMENLEKKINVGIEKLRESVGLSTWADKKREDEYLANRSRQNNRTTPSSLRGPSGGESSNLKAGAEPNPTARPARETSTPKEKAAHADLVGPIIEYQKRLTNIADSIAPAWVKQLERLGAEGDHINRQLDYYSKQYGEVFRKKERELKVAQAINNEQKRAASLQRSLLSPRDRAAQDREDRKLGRKERALKTLGKESSEDQGGHSDFDETGKRIPSKRDYQSQLGNHDVKHGAYGYKSSVFKSPSQGGNEFRDSKFTNATIDGKLSLK